MQILEWDIQLPNNQAFESDFFFTNLVLQEFIKKLKKQCTLGSQSPSFHSFVLDFWTSIHQENCKGTIFILITACFSMDSKLVLKSLYE